MMNKILDNYNSNDNNNDKITKVDSDTFSFNVYPNHISKDQCLDNSIPKVNIDSECEKKIKDKYNIPLEEDIFIAEMVYDQSKSKTSGTNKVDYEIYSKDNKKLDTSICDTISLSIPLNSNNPNLNLDMAKEIFNEFNSNIYNSSEKIFQDFCIPLRMKDKDICMDDRLNKIYTNMNFCDLGCEIKQLDVNKEVVECECDTKEDKSNNNNNDKNEKDDNLNSLLEENEFIEIITTLLKNTNFKMLRCYKNINFINNEKFNYGNGITLVIIILEIGSVIIFFFSHINSIYAIIFRYLNPISISCPPKKNNYNIKNKINDNSSEENYTSINKIEISNSNLSDSKKRLPDKKELIKPEKNENELNECDNFDEIKQDDKRKGYQYYFSILIEKQIFISTIFNKSDFYPYSLRIILFSFSIASFFFLNGLFYTEEYIKKRYEQNKSLGFFYIINNELKKSIFASMIAIIITKIISLIINNSNNLQNLMKYKNNNNIFYKKLTRLICIIRFKYFFILFFIIVLSIIYWYFLFIFCKIFQNNQISWIQSTAISIGINILFYIIMCFIITCLRFISLKYKFRLLFTVNHFIYSLI